MAEQAKKTTVEDVIEVYKRNWTKVVDESTKLQSELQQAYLDIAKAATDQVVALQKAYFSAFRSIVPGGATLTPSKEVTESSVKVAELNTQLVSAGIDAVRKGWQNASQVYSELQKSGVALTKAAVSTWANVWNAYER